MGAGHKTFLSQPLGHANATALSYRAHLIERGLAPSTINRRLASLRSLVKLGRTLGFVSWSLEVANVRSKAYRDTRGPGVHAIRAMLTKLKETGDAKAVRDTCILRLLFDLGLRRGELVRLDVEDVEDDTIWILGKGRTEKEGLRLAERTQEALGAWLAIRGTRIGCLVHVLRPSPTGLRKAVRISRLQSGGKVRCRGGC